jgi:hypothetical protein
LIKFISLWDIMKIFSPHPLVQIAAGLSLIKGAVGSGTPKDTVFSDDLREQLVVRYTEAENECRNTGLTLSAMSAHRIVVELSKAGATYGVFIHHGTEWLRRVTDEMKLRIFITIEPSNQHFITDLHPFGENVGSMFPSTDRDIEEAGKCIAFERYTAAVYHLMRVAEAAVVVISKRVGYESPKAGWGEALKFIDNGLKKARDKYEEASPLFKGDVEFLSEVSAQMHAVNQAWRQRVAHIERSYSEEEALRIWDATKGLMQHLATKLKEAQNE